MSVSAETLELIKEGIRNGADVKGSLVRSKLTNRLVWNGAGCTQDDPYGEYLRAIGAAPVAEVEQLQSKASSMMHVHDDQRVVLGEKNRVVTPEKSGRKNGTSKHDKENWRNQWEHLKKANSYCSLCKNNKEGREVYLSHDLKGPNGEITCPILQKCVCRYCGKQGHTIAYCPDNQTGTSVLKMINRHNRI